MTIIRVSYAELSAELLPGNRQDNHLSETKSLSSKVHECPTWGTIQTNRKIKQSRNTFPKFIPRQQNVNAHYAHAQCAPTRVVRRREHMQLKLNL